MGDLTQTLLKSQCEPGRSRLERVRIVRLENDFDVGTVGAEAWVRAYTDLRVDLYCLGENPDDPALRRAVAVTPGSDRRTRAQLALDRLVHRLHLRRQAGEDVDVFEHEPGRPAERVGQWAAAGGKPGPAGRILRVGSKRAPSSPATALYSVFSTPKTAATASRGTSSCGPPTPLVARAGEWRSRGLRHLGPQVGRARRGRPVLARRPA